MFPEEPHESVEGTALSSHPMNRDGTSRTGLLKQTRLDS